MGIWRQTSLFAYKNDWTLENIIPSFKFMGEPTSYALVRKQIERFTKEGDLVFDPGCGNGTTGVIAMELRRRAVLSDLNALAVQTVQALFEPCDNQEVIAYCKEIAQHIGIMNAERAIQVLDSAVLEIASAVEGREGSPGLHRGAGVQEPWLHRVQEEKWQTAWNNFIQAEIPSLAAFSRILRKRANTIGELFHPHDLEQLQWMYIEISGISEDSIREFLLTVFYHTLLESSQLVRNRGRQTLSVPQNLVRKHPVERFRENLELFLAYRKMIREKLLQNGAGVPAVVQSSVYALEFLAPESVDYILFDLPGIQMIRESEWSYIPELLMCAKTDPKEELALELDYRGRYRLVREIKRMLTELERVLKENAYLTLLFAGHYVLLSLVIRVAQEEGWQLIQGNVEMIKQGKKEEYPLMSLTLQKKSHHAVLGALNKMKIETLYDTEEAILRKIDHYLTEHRTATTEEIQQFLITSYLHDCLIEKPLEHLLGENYLWSGRYWLQPSAEQQEELFAKRTRVMEESVPAFVAEMIYIFLREERSALTYEELACRLLQLKPRAVFHTPYYRLLIEQCERREVKLHTLMDRYLRNEQKDPFETPAAVIRRWVRNDPTFVELVPGEWVALEEWSKDHFFKEYLELYEKAKRKQDAQLTRGIGKKVLELLPDVTYLEECKKLKICEYIVRSEGL